MLFNLPESESIPSAAHPTCPECNKQTVSSCMAACHSSKNEVTSLDGKNSFTPPGSSRLLNAFSITIASVHVPFPFSLVSTRDP